MARRIPPRRARPDAAGAGRLWTPWRSAYISRARAGGAPCIFCFGRLGISGRRQRLVLHADPLALVMLNRYPYASGHLLVAPRRDVASPELLSGAELAATSAMIARTVAHLRAAFKPDGLNLGANLGRAAGAGIADHLHWHLVPRWEGDTNFMPVIGSTRVLSQALEETYMLLGPHFQAAGAALT
jgi:ATP adenylyltransferase